MSHYQLSYQSVNGVMVDPVTSVPDLGTYIDADLSIKTHDQRNVLHCACSALAVAADTQTGTASHVPETGGRSFSVVTGLLQWHTGRPTCVFRALTPSATECV